MSTRSPLATPPSVEATRSPGDDDDGLDASPALVQTHESLCEYCGGAECGGDCAAYYDAMADDTDAQYETWRDREIP